jgi:hypothetical protein
LGLYPWFVTGISRDSAINGVFFDMKVEQTDISIEDREIPVGNWDVFVFT